MCDKAISLLQCSCRLCSSTSTALRSHTRYRYEFPCLLCIFVCPTPWL